MFNVMQLFAPQTLILWLCPQMKLSPVYSNINTITFENSWVFCPTRGWFKKCMKITVRAHILTLNSGFVNICTIALSNGPPWRTFRQSFIFNPCLKSGGLKTDILVENYFKGFNIFQEYTIQIICIYVPVLPSGSAASWPGQCVYGVCFVTLSYAFWKKNYWSATLVLKKAYTLRFFQDSGKSSTRKSGQTQIIHEVGLLKRIKQCPELNHFLDANLNLFWFWFYQPVSQVVEFCNSFKKWRLYSTQ